MDVCKPLVNGYTLMHVAAALGRADAVRWLLEVGVAAAGGSSGNEAVPGGMTPLHCAAAAGAAGVPATEVLLRTGGWAWQSSLATS